MNPYEVEVIVPLDNAGMRSPCRRCGTPCMVAATANRAGAPLQHADGEGVCAGCALTAWLRSPDIDISYLLPAGTDCREALRLPHVQKIIAHIFKVGHSDVTGEQINWERLIANWDLPMPKQSRKRKAAKETK